MSAKIQVRRDTAANWTTQNPTLLRGEIGYEYDTVKLKIGNGSTAWNSLAYAIVSQTMVEDLIADHADRTDNPHSVTKAQVGLPNVDDISSTYLLDRTNHTGTQTVSTLSDFTVEVDALIDAQKGSTIATLDVGGKVPASQLPNTIMEFKGTWDASTNTPTLANGNPPNISEDAGHVYVCAVAGTVDFGAGNITFAEGDWVILSASLVWEKSTNSNAVVSVNGYQGAVNLSKSDIGLGNVPNVDATARSNHTGTQLAATISDFTSAVQAVTIDAAKIDGGVVSNAEFATLDGITTGVSIQSQINGKEPTIASGTTAQYWRGDKSFQTLDKTAVGLANVDNVSAADLRDRSTHTGNESQLTFSETSEPAAPASGLTLYTETIGGRAMLVQKAKAGRAYPFQPSLGAMPFQFWLPNANANSSTVLGQVAPTATGTATARTVAVTNSFTWQRRIGFVSAGGAGQTSGLRSAVLQFGLGNAAGVGGFFFQTRFGISDAALVANARSAIGLTATTTAFANADPSTFLNFLGMAHDAADTNWQIMFNDGAGAATKVDLGANFTRSPTVSTVMYDLVIYCPPNSSTVFYEVKNIANGAVASGTMTTNIPANTQLLTWQLWRSNNATASAVALDIASVYIETEI